MIKNSDHDRRSNRASEVEEYDGRMVWINAESSPQSVARSITGAAMPSARNGFPVYLFSKYDKNSNVAVKGIISAQHNLQERHATTISFKPTFRANRNELTFKVEKEGDEPEFKRNPSILDSVQQLSVASGTDPKVRMRVYAWMALFIKHLLWPTFSTLQILAGAIAKQARTGSILAVRAIGAKAVFEMVRAVGIARAYLEDDGLGQDLKAFPDFVKVNLPSREEPTNALRLIVLMTSQNAPNSSQGFGVDGS